MGSKELPWTGERLVTSLSGGIVCEHLHRYAIAREMVAGKDVLDIACGEGYGVALFAQCARSVVGVDVDRAVVEHAEAKYGGGNTRFLQGECVAIPLGEASVDVVVSFETIEHIREQEQFLAEVRRVLRPGGILIVSTPDKRVYTDQLGNRNQFHPRELEAEEFYSLLAQHFTHTATLSQRVGLGSFVAPMHRGDDIEIGNHRGDWSGIDFTPGVADGVYLLAVCSNAPLPPVRVGFFEFNGWSFDGKSVREACFVQVWADHGGGYRQPLTADGWQSVVFEHLEDLHTDGVRRLRIDLINQPALVEVASVRVTREADGAVLYDASSAAEFGRLEHSANGLSHLAGEHLLLVATDSRPQLFLPLLEDFRGVACTLELRLRVEIALPGVLRRLHEFAGENKALDAIAATLKSRIDDLETATATLQQSHDETRAALEVSRSHAESLVHELVELRGGVALREEQLRAVRREAREQQRMIESLRGELDIAYAELGEIKSSRFWRFSSPVRSIGRRLARLFERIHLRAPWNKALRRQWKLIRGCRLMDSRWYFLRHPSAGRGKRDPILHYLRTGAAEGRDPHPLFDTSWYLERNPDVAKAGLNPLVHYFLHGGPEGRHPSPLFDGRWYLDQYPDVAATGGNPLVHYLLHGVAEGRDPNPLFDTSWYLEKNPDVVAAGENPLIHFLRDGAGEGRDPHPHFDTNWYLEENPDVAKAGLNPLVHYLLHGGGEGRHPSPLFDGRWYLDQYPDVAAAGANPLVHYLMHGAAEGRRVHPVVAESPVSREKAPPAVLRRRVVFVSGEPDSPGHCYRVGMMARALEELGFETRTLHLAQIRTDLEAVAEAHALVIWRAPWSESMAAVIEIAKHNGVRIVFDVDDLMIDPALARTEVIDGIRSQGFTEAAISDFFHLVRQTMLAADFCTCPTQPLATAMRRWNIPTLVLPNGFDGSRLVRSRKAVASRHSRRSDGCIRLGYAGGSRTHQRDFARAVSAVARVLREHPECLLVLFRLSNPDGELRFLNVAEFPELCGLEAQIEWRSFVPHDALPDELARFDINLAPLETDNPFCEAKSELKYFEAALVDVVTVASPTAPFAAAIRHGETGFLAADEAEWYAALKRLVGDPDLRATVARNAFHDVLWPYGPERRADLVAALFEQVLGDSRLASRSFELEIRRSSAPHCPPPQIPVFEVIVESGSRAQCDVAVVVPLHNYAQFVEEALDSVRRQSLARKELIVIDDCSTDDSLAVARRWIERHRSELTYVALLKNRENSGLALTRNAGFAFAEARFILPLDADNVLEPHCLERCLAAIKTSGAAVAYPTIVRFGDGVGFVSASSWCPARFAAGNYIDAMALVRKSAWSAVGGYLHMQTMGWEDFEMWCRFVEDGFWGTWVKESLARYRVHGASMLQVGHSTDEKRQSLIDEIRALHPWVDDAALAATWVRHSELLESQAKEALTESTASIGREAQTLPVSPPLAADDEELPRPRTRERLEELLPLLRCPQSAKPLRLVSDEWLETDDGANRWPVQDWHPIFFDEGGPTRTFPDTHLSNPVPPKALEIAVHAAGPVLNISAGGSRTWLPNLIELETAIFRNTDIVGDGHALPFADGVFDAVLAINAFEHYHDPDQAVAEILRVLKPGGKVFIHTAFLQPLHEPPWHFFNCTKFGLLRWFKQFEVVELGVSENFNPIYSLSWQASDLLAVMNAERGTGAAERAGAMTLEKLAGFWRDEKSRQEPCWADFQELSQQAQERLAAGFEFIGRKQPV